MEWYSDEAWQLWRWCKDEPNKIKSSKLLRIAEGIEMTHRKDHPKIIRYYDGHIKINNSDIIHKAKDIIDGYLVARG